MHIPENIILSRTDGIGDMVLMLPMAGVLKQHFPGIKIAILGKPYTRALVEACVYSDEFIDVADFFSGPVTVCGQKPQAFINVRTDKEVAKRAKKLGIPVRVGTKSRLYHWTTCNKLVKLRRKRSRLHEAQLNIKLLAPFGIKKKYSTTELSRLFGLEKLQPLSEENAALIDPDKYNLIIHPKSQGSSREWPLGHFVSLINILSAEKFNIFISGVEKEKVFIKHITDNINRPVIDLGGKMSMDSFMPFIEACDGIIANATGPIHLGAALGIDALGLYPPMRPIDPGRWAPLGGKVKVFVLNKDCNECKGKKDFCACINAIEPSMLAFSLDMLFVNKFSKQSVKA